ncbi:MAG: InlB B-repeat-containing protein [Lachnospiraceae bacterium]|nr:InlB B-repeat-containing protein [Lachnospiraceae bacterium]
MRKKGVAWGVLLVLMLCLSMMSGAALAAEDDEVEDVSEGIKDEAFRAWVIANYDDDGDGKISQTEANEVVSIYVTEQDLTEIDSLEGIELFPNLVELYCVGGHLTSLDVSKNTNLTSLSCSTNQLTELKLNEGDKLTFLFCSANPLTTLDISKVTSLNALVNAKKDSVSVYTYNPKDLDGVPTNVGYDFEGENSERLNIALETKLITDPEISYITVSFVSDGETVEQVSCLPGTGFLAPELNREDAAFGGWFLDENYEDRFYSASSEDGTMFVTDSKVYAKWYSVSEFEEAFPDETFRSYVLDLFDCMNAEGINDGTQDGILTDEEKALAWDLYIDPEQMKSITDLTGIKEFPNLTELTCSGSFGTLQSLDVSGMTSLRWLDCEDNGLGELDLEGCENLYRLTCRGNYIPTVDVTSCKALNNLVNDSSATFYACVVDPNDPYTGLYFAYVIEDEEPANECPYIFVDSQTRIISDPELPYVTVTFVDGEDEVAAMITLEGYTVARLVEPGAEDKIFLGWFADLDDEEPVQFADSWESTLFYEDTTLYAKWLTPQPGVGVEIATKFKDPALRRFVEQFDLTGEGWLSDEEIARVTEFVIYDEVDWDEIKDFSGIEIFTAIKFLNLTSQAADEMDFSVFPELETLMTPRGLKSLDISKNTKLTELDIDEGAMEKVDLSAYPNLTSLVIYGGTIKTIILGDKPYLEGVAIFSTSIESIDVSGLTAVTGLDLYDNRLKSLDVSMLTQLTHLNCNGNELTSLNVANNTNLYCLECARNKLTSIDISKLTGLYEFECQGNQITQLIVKDNPFLISAMKGGGKEKTDYNKDGEFNYTLYEYVINLVPDSEEGNYLTHARFGVDTATEIEPVITDDDLTDVEKQLRSMFPDADFRNAVIGCLDRAEDGYDSGDGIITEEELAQIGDITSIYLGEVTDFTGLEYLTGLTSLEIESSNYAKDLETDPAVKINLSKNTSLQYLMIARYHLTSLDLSANTELTNLCLSDSYVESLNVSGLSNLAILDLRGNLIETVDLSDNPILSGLYDTTELVMVNDFRWQEARYFMTMCFGEETDESYLFVVESTVVVTPNSPEKCKVSFETNGAGSIDSQTIDFGTKAAEPTAPEKTNFVLAGWYTDSECTNKFDFARKVGRDITLYAKWDTEYKSFSDEEGSKVEPYVSGSNKTYTVVIKPSGEVDNSYENLRDIFWDGVSVFKNPKVKHYKSSTVIELSPEFMKDVAVGEHTLTVEFTDGTIEVPVAVQNAQTTEPGGDQPATGTETPKEETPAGTETPKEETPAGTETPKEETPAGTQTPKEETPAGTETPKDNTSTNGTQTPGTSQENASNGNVTSPKTADNAPLVALIVLAMVAILGIGVIVVRSRAAEKN